jgi:hypothetical protein
LFAPHWCVAGVVATLQSPPSAAVGAAFDVTSGGRGMSGTPRIVVLGTGGAGLAAAIAAHDAGTHAGRRVVMQVFEKADKVGGTIAWSGGMVWIPNNHLEAQAGVPDSREEAGDHRADARRAGRSPRYSCDWAGSHRSTLERAGGGGPRR